MGYVLNVMHTMTFVILHHTHVDGHLFRDASGIHLKNQMLV